MKFLFHPKFRYWFGLYLMVSPLVRIPLIYGSYYYKFKFMGAENLAGNLTSGYLAENWISIPITFLAGLLLFRTANLKIATKDAPPPAVPQVHAPQTGYKNHETQ